MQPSARSASTTPTSPPSETRGLRGALRRARASIAGRTLGLFVLVTLVPLVVALVQTRNDALEAQVRAETNARAVARAAAAEVEESIQAAYRVGQMLARLPGFWDGT